MSKRYEDSFLIETVKNSHNYSQVLKNLGLAAAGGNFVNIKRKIEVLGLSTSHFTGQSSTKGMKLGPKKPTSFYLVEGRACSSHWLKNRLLSEGVFQRKCYSCDLTIWIDVPIPLELEHIDGNHDNNKLENLTLLCPNCHALTPTYRRRNKKYPALKLSSEIDPDKVSKVAKPRATKIKWPAPSEVLSAVNTTSYSAVARNLGVSDNAVRKFLCKHDLL